MPRPGTPTGPSGTGVAIHISRWNRTCEPAPQLLRATGMPLSNPASWWHWDFELSTHVEQRMHERGMTEVELRAMLDRATTLEPSVIAGRFVAHCRHRGQPWRVVLEPDMTVACVVVVTVYLKEVS